MPRDAGRSFGSRLPAALPPDTLLVCALDPRRVCASSLAAVLPLLSNDERTRLAGIRLEQVRREYLVARGMVRLLLGRLLGEPPSSLTFTTGPHGKPELARGNAARLRFNLSHTHGMVVLAVTRESDLGVDVEWPRRRARMLDVAERYFHPAECAALRALPRRLRRERFFTLWTLKEAYIKARGLGVPAPLRQFAFSFRGRSLRAFFDVALGENPAHWQMVRRRLHSGHVVAIAVATGPSSRLRVRWCTVPSLEAIRPAQAQLVKSG